MPQKYDYFSTERMKAKILKETWDFKSENQE